MLNRLPSLELPLLKRELIELAQRKRTYALRCLCLAVLAMVFLVVYVEFTSRASNMMWMLGRGRDLTSALFITLMCLVYALAPAMTCAAITSEKEKQTLGLLLISKLTPGGIVVEKMLSRMLPLLSLIVVAAPLFAISYLFGGVSFVDTLMGIGLLLFIVFQITAVAVFCSALLESGLAAFWATYSVLASIYFTWPILVEFDFLPRAQLFPSLPDSEFVLFPGYQLAMFVDRVSTWQEIAWLTIPSLVVTIIFPIAARFAVVWFSYGAAFSFAKKLSNSGPYRKFRQFVSRKPWLSAAAAESENSHSGYPEARRLPDAHAIQWRERRTGILQKPRVQIAAIAALLFLEAWILSEVRYDDDVCVFISVVTLIISLLMVMSHTCKLFARERERQTLDSLLVAPLTNRQILKEKQAGINRLIWFLMVVVFVTGIFNVTHVRMQVSSLTHPFASGSGYYNRNTAIHFSFDWWAAAVLFFVCALGNAWIYMNLIKWTALYFGLRLNTQMKAMMATLLTILGLCFIPIMITTLIMLAIGADPSDFPLWFFTSPIVIPGLNEWHDLIEIYRRSWMPASDVLIVLMNFAIYGGIMLAARFFVLTQLTNLLSRRDEPSVQIIAHAAESVPHLTPKEIPST